MVSALDCAQPNLTDAKPCLLAVPLSEHRLRQSERTDRNEALALVGSGVRHYKSYPSLRALKGCPADGLRRPPTLESIALIVELLRTRGMRRSTMPAEVCRRLERLTSVKFELGLSCPLPSDHLQPMFVQFDCDGAYSLVREAPTGCKFVQGFKAAGLDESGLLHPKAYLRADEAVLPEATFEDALAFTSDLLTRFVQRQRALIRRLLVDARSHSDDLGSFSHRVINAVALRELIGFEAASLFIVDPIGGRLRLRGTTGLAAKNRKVDVSFAADDQTKIGRTFCNQRPLAEFVETGSLAEVSSAEILVRDTWFRSYWPLHLQQRIDEESRRTARAPVLGVLRLVNVDRDDALRAPPTWIDCSSTEFLAESLYNVVLGFQDAQKATFQREDAFHAAAGIVDSMNATVDRLSQWTLGERLNSDGFDIRQRFDIRSRRTEDDIEPVRRLIRTVYAGALTLGFQIERADTDISHSPTDVTPELLKSVILRSLDMLPHIAHAHSIEERIIRPDLASILKGGKYPPPVRGSPDSLNSVMVNVLENAAKYRRTGETCRIDLDFETEKDSVIIRVRDYGIGVSLVDIDRIFTRGFRTDTAKTHSMRGGGLGLNWCAEVLQRLGGRITAKHEEPGLTIIIELPRADN